MASFGQKPSAPQGGFGKKAARPAMNTGGQRFSAPASAAPASDELSPQAMAFLNDYKTDSGNGEPSAPLMSGEGHVGGTPVGFMRVFSYLIDSLIITLPLTIFMWPFILTQLEIMASAPEGSSEAAMANLELYKVVLINAVVRCVYAVGMESSALQATVGKMLLGQIVTNKQMTQPSLVQVIMRNTVGRFVLNIIPFNIGYIMAFFGEKKGVHDMICGTRVCKKVAAGYKGSMGEVFA